MLKIYRTHVSVYVKPPHRTTRPTRKRKCHCKLTCIHLDKRPHSHAHATMFVDCRQFSCGVALCDTNNVRTIVPTASVGIHRVHLLFLKSVCKSFLFCFFLKMNWIAARATSDMQWTYTHFGVHFLRRKLVRAFSHRNIAHWFFT